MTLYYCVRLSHYCVNPCPSTCTSKWRTLFWWPSRSALQFGAHWSDDQAAAHYRLALAVPMVGPRLNINTFAIGITTNWKHAKHVPGRPVLRTVIEYMLKHLPQKRLHKPLKLCVNTETPKKWYFKSVQKTGRRNWLKNSQCFFVILIASMCDT